MQHYAANMSFHHLGALELSMLSVKYVSMIVGMPAAAGIAGTLLVSLPKLATLRLAQSRLSSFPALPPAPGGDSLRVIDVSGNQISQACCLAFKSPSPVPVDFSRIILLVKSNPNSVQGRRARIFLRPPACGLVLKVSCLTRVALVCNSDLTSACPSCHVTC